MRATWLRAGGGEGETAENGRFREVMGESNNLYKDS